MSSEYNDKTSKARSDLHKICVNNQTFTSCLNCSNWVDDSVTGNQGCALFEAMPPPHIIVFGCDKHQFDVPF